MFIINHFKVSRLQKKALEKSRNQQYMEAIETYNEIIELDDKDFVPFYNRGLAWANLKQYEKAIENFDKAISLCQNVYYSEERGYYGEYSVIKDIFYHRGLVKGELEQYETAINDFSESISRSKKPAYLRARAVSYYRSGKSGEAFDDINIAIKLDPKNPSLYIIRGEVRLDVALFEMVVEQTIKDYEKAIKLNPSYEGKFREKIDDLSAKRNRQACIQKERDLSNAKQTYIASERNEDTFCEELHRDNKQDFVDGKISLSEYNKRNSIINDNSPDVALNSIISRQAIDGIVNVATAPFHLVKKAGIFATEQVVQTKVSSNNKIQKTFTKSN